MSRRITIIFPDRNHHKFITLHQSAKLIHRCDRRPDIYIVRMKLRFRPLPSGAHSLTFAIILPHRKVTNA